MYRKKTRIAMKSTTSSPDRPPFVLELTFPTPKFFVLNILTRLLLLFSSFRVFFNRQTSSENFILQGELKLTSLCRCRSCHRKILYYFSYFKKFSLTHFLCWWWHEGKCIGLQKAQTTRLVINFLPKN